MTRTSWRSSSPGEGRHLTSSEQQWRNWLNSQLTHRSVGARMTFDPADPSCRRRRPQLARRDVLRGGLWLGVGLGTAPLLAACGGDGSQQAGGAPYPLARPDSPVTQPIKDSNPGIDDGLEPETGGAFKILNYDQYMAPGVMTGLRRAARRRGAGHAVHELRRDAVEAARPGRVLRPRLPGSQRAEQDGVRRPPPAAQPLVPAPPRERLAGRTRTPGTTRVRGTPCRTRSTGRVSSTGPTRCRASRTTATT